MVYNELSQKLRTDLTKDLLRSRRSSMLLCLFVFLLLIANISIADVDTIGTGSGLYDHLPIEPYFCFTYSQSIYLQGDINVSGPVYIDSIEYEYNGISSWTDDIDVYMGHTTNSSFSTWKPVSTMTLVYTGDYSVSASSGWYRIVLDEPFYYNNTNNLAIAVDEDTPTYHAYGSSFYTTSQGTNRSIYYYDDSYNPNPSSPPTGVLSNYCPNIIIYYHYPPTEDYDDWNYSKNLYINTTSTGVEISSDVLDFPLLVRLNSDNFDFSQAKSDGTDIRFAKSAGGNPLQYEIERWDETNEIAEVWVNVDSIYGNNDEQYIVMYWGKSDALDLSSPGAVFDYENDFKGTWHLDNFNDATIYNNHGTDHNTGDITGIIGKAKDFDGSDDYISLPDACMVSGSWTLSFWVKPNSPDNYDRIFIQGSGGCSSSQVMASWKTDFIEFLADTDGSGGVPQIASGTIPVGEWTHVMWTFNGTTHNVYVNGVSSTDTATSDNNGVNGNNYIGTRAGGGNCWDGILDEIRISAVARTVDWAELCYGNQKENQTLVQSYEYPEDCGPGEKMKVDGKIALNPINDFKKPSVKLWSEYFPSHLSTRLNIKVPSDYGDILLKLDESGLKLTNDSADNPTSIHANIITVDTCNATSFNVDSFTTENLEVTNTITANDINAVNTVTALQFKIGEWTIETPDYVFGKDYKLPLLEEVEKFLKENKHLPEVPSAEDMKKEGVDLSKLNMILLKKIEELHLYTIKQNKELEEQNKKIEKLGKEVDALRR